MFPSTLSDQIRARLRSLHHTIVGATQSRPSWRTPLRDHPSPAQRVLPQLAPEDWLARAEEIENGSGKHLRFRQPLAELWAGALKASEYRGTARPDMHPELAALAESFPGTALFLDLETCGFAGSAVFLAGLVRPIDGTLVVEQLFARTYAEERAVLETLWQSLGASRVLVTFNGKSFDWPMVRDRSTRHRLTSRQPGFDARPARTASGRLANGPSPELVHCDLLHHARRRFKGVLPNCRLQTLERYLCRRSRHNDLDGSAVPAAYHQFVRSGRGAEVGAILSHNALDLVTLVEIAQRLLAA